MTTNTHEHTISSLTNRVLAVIDSVDDADHVIGELTDVGVPTGRVWALRGSDGVACLDADGRNGGRFERSLRAIQSLSTEGEHLRAYEQELRHGHVVLDIPVPRASVRRRVAERLRALGAHCINVYGAWTIEPIAG